MIVLGIADNHDSGAALIANGEIVAAINQERLDRQKNSSAFPYSAIDAVLQEAGMQTHDVDTVVVGTSYTPATILRMAPRFHQSAKKNGQFSTSLHMYMMYQSVLRRTGMARFEQRASHFVLQQKLKNARLRTQPLVLMDHHEAHAQGAYRTQRHKKCLVMTLDAMGDGCTASVWKGEGDQLLPLWDQSGLAAINLFYSRVTELLGFTPLRHEGKITGLSARGIPDQKLRMAMQKHVRFANGKFRRMPIAPASKKDSLWHMIATMNREVVSATAQQVLEEATCAFVSYWVQRTKISHIALSGGVFANVRLNQKIANLPEVEEIWVYPHMGDGGLALGGALGFTRFIPQDIDNAFLGTQHRSIDRMRAIQRAKVRVVKEEQIATLVKIIASGGVIARSSGGMEWGPRALGNRSVLASVSDPQINTTLNQKLNRSEFMPFAPMVLAEDAEEYFYHLPQYGRCTRFMTTCVDTTPKFQQEAPAAVHIDGTARPQIIHREDHPQIHALLCEMKAQTGVGVLINTSFNLHEEPIVCTPDESIRAAKLANLDALWLDDTLLLF